MMGREKNNELGHLCTEQTIIADLYNQQFGGLRAKFMSKKLAHMLNRIEALCQHDKPRLLVNLRTRQKIL